MDAVQTLPQRVEVHRAGEDSSSGWIVVHDTPAAFDLLQLVGGASAVLADHALAPGHYTQLRLILGDGSYVVEAGERHDLSVPSGLQTGLKLIHPFDIEPEQIYEVTLDFDAARSIHVTGNGQHLLRPTIRCVWNAIAGAVTGTVLPAAAKSTVWTVAGGDTVSAFADSLTGGFRLSMLPAGIYDLRVAPRPQVWCPGRARPHATSVGPCPSCTSGPALDERAAPDGVSGCRRASWRRSRCPG